MTMKALREHRVGESTGDTFRATTHALRVFALRLSQAHGSEVGKARASMTLLETLLTETVPRLNANFATLGALVTARTGAGSGVPPDAVDAAMTAVLDDSVIALQFGDLASQMVQHTQACLDAIDRLDRELERLHEAADDTAIEQLQSAIEAVRPSPPCPARTPRSTVELF